MIPPFDKEGKLPPGMHWADWQDFVQRFGGTPYRAALIAGLKTALDALRFAGCQTAYIDGSFVTHKGIGTPEPPNDYDGCWSMVGVDPTRLDPVLLSFDNGRAMQKAKYLGEFFPAEWTESISGLTFLEFFQQDKDTGDPKGIIALDLRRLP